ncbi:MAG: hypothetical protein ACJA1Z_003597 [Patiriisocius sp.]|jgi:hypothetical protein
MRFANEFYICNLFTKLEAKSHNKNHNPNLNLKNTILITAMLFCLLACSSTKNISKNHKHTFIDDNTFKIAEISTDPSYGLSPKNPIEVGNIGSGPKNERRYLNALSGPNGEPISYFRLGSCCAIKSDKAIYGKTVLLDNYGVTWEGADDTISIYINMYDAGELKAPQGFRIGGN